MASLGIALLAGCETEPPTREEAAIICDRRAQAAQAPDVSGQVAISNREGPSVGLSIGLSADLLRGRDPLEVYDECVFDLTGEPPIRPARLRAL
ncbi:MAG: hypothetical protein AAFQ09_02515 [Pseudomonadota bacterium]